MLSNPQYQEIDHRTIKLLVGSIAISLAPLTSFLTNWKITSISESYWFGGFAQSIFVGFLFAIASFMLAYNGQSAREKVFSKFAAIAAMGIALFPCNCGGRAEIIPYVHMGSAAVMFSILAYFCCLFRQRACGKGHSEAIRRARVYATCGVLILLSIAIPLVDVISQHRLSDSWKSLTFWDEALGLTAFGVSWLTASRVTPGLASPAERFRIFEGRTMERELPPR
jgi:hypothetical protein